MSRKRLEIKEGERYGRLTVIREVEPHVNHNGEKERRILCKCDCDGKEIEVRPTDLKSGNTKSCGCYKREKTKERLSKQNEYKIDALSGIVTGYTAKGESFLIDIDDLEKIKPYCWGLDSKGYIRAYGHKKDRTRIALHRFILNAPDNMAVDHINRNPLDNRKSNLRLCTLSENSKNIGIRSNNTSGATGICWDKRMNKWYARIYSEGKNIYLGSFNDFEEARMARLKAEEKICGEFSSNYDEIKNLKIQNKVLTNDFKHDKI